jgi:hypothetical protein
VQQRRLGVRLRALLLAGAIATAVAAAVSGTAAGGPAPTVAAGPAALESSPTPAATAPTGVVRSSPPATVGLNPVQPAVEWWDRIDPDCGLYVPAVVDEPGVAFEFADASRIGDTQFGWTSTAGWSVGLSIWPQDNRNVTTWFDRDPEGTVVAGDRVIRSTGPSGMVAVPGQPCFYEVRLHGDGLPGATEVLATMRLVTGPAPVGEELPQDPRPYEAWWDTSPVMARGDDERIVQGWESSAGARPDCPLYAPLGLAADAGHTVDTARAIDTGRFEVVWSTVADDSADVATIRWEIVALPDPAIDRAIDAAGTVDPHVDGSTVVFTPAGRVFLLAGTGCAYVLDLSDTALFAYGWAIRGVRPVG